MNNLLAHGRAWQALDLLASYLETVKPEAGIVMDVLEAALAAPVDHPGQSLLYDISQIFTYREHLARSLIWPLRELLTPLHVVVNLGETQVV